MPAILIPVNSGKPIVLDKPIVLVGRHPDCDAVILNSRKISRKHCAIALVNNNFVVRDLGSMNGIWVNGARVETQSPVNFGDELVIGDVAFTLQADKPGGKKGEKGAPVMAPTPVAPSKPVRAAEPPPPVRKKALVTPPNADLSMEFPVPIDDEANDGFNVPPPQQKPLGGDTAEDDFIPLQDH